MSPKSNPTVSSGSGGQHGAPNRSHRSSERPRGKSKRTLIESACSACQRRKSRCDGQRPVCSRCQTLRTECEYHAQEGESRWSALRRKNQDLERERDEAREILSVMQRGPESEADEIYHRLRTDSNAADLGALIHDVASTLPQDPSRQAQAAQQVEEPQPSPHQHPDELSRHSLQLQPQSQQRPPIQAQQQFPQISPTHPQASFTQPNYSAVGPGTQLPPIQSLVGMPLQPANSHATQHSPPPAFSSSDQQRNIGLGSSNVSTGSYSSPSEDGRDQYSLSPRDERPHAWAHGHNQS